MDLGAFELQIFVSLIVVLGAAFVALVCDYLKGNNEQLREHNIELRVRKDEQERRGILDPARWLEQLVSLTQSKAEAKAAAQGPQPRTTPVEPHEMMNSWASRQELDRTAQRAASMGGRRNREQRGNVEDWVTPETLARIAAKMGSQPSDATAEGPELDKDETVTAPQAEVRRAASEAKTEARHVTSDAKADIRDQIQKIVESSPRPRRWKGDNKSGDSQPARKTNTGVTQAAEEPRPATVAVAEPERVLAVAEVAREQEVADQAEIKKFPVLAEKQESAPQPITLAAELERLSQGQIRPAQSSGVASNVAQFPIRQIAPLKLNEELQRVAEAGKPDVKNAHSKLVPPAASGAGPSGLLDDVIEASSHPGRRAAETIRQHVEPEIASGSWPLAPVAESKPGQSIAPQALTKDLQKTPVAPELPAPIEPVALSEFVPPLSSELAMDVHHSNLVNEPAAAHVETSTGAVELQAAAAPNETILAEQPKEEVSAVQKQVFEEPFFEEPAFEEPAFEEMGSPLEMATVEVVASVEREEEVPAGLALEPVVSNQRIQTEQPLAAFEPEQMAEPKLEPVMDLVPSWSAAPVAEATSTTAEVSMIVTPEVAKAPQLEAPRHAAEIIAEPEPQLPASVETAFSWPPARSFHTNRPASKHVSMPAISEPWFQPSEPVQEKPREAAVTPVVTPPSIEDPRNLTCLEDNSIVAVPQPPEPAMFQAMIESISLLPVEERDSEPALHQVPDTLAPLLAGSRPVAMISGGFDSDEQESNANSAEGQALLLPAGMHDRLTFSRLMDAPGTLSGVVVSISLNDHKKIQDSLTHQAFEDLMRSINKLMNSLIRDQDFGVRLEDSEWVFVYGNEVGAAAQKRILQISERLWDFQLRSMGSISILFGWGAVEVENERLSGAYNASIERMEQSRRGRKTVGMDSREKRRVANG